MKHRKTSGSALHFRKTPIAVALSAMAVSPLSFAALGPGTPLGPEFLVNTYTHFAQEHADVAYDATGNFVVVWDSYRQESPPRCRSYYYSYSCDYAEGVYAQRYNAQGAAIGGEFHVNTTTRFAQENPRVAMAPSGQFVVVWEDSHKDGSRDGVFAQCFDAQANPVGMEFQVNTNTAGEQSVPVVAMDGMGNFTVAWQSDYVDGSGEGISAQRFNAQCNPVGGEWVVNTFAAGDQAKPSIAEDVFGNTVIAWQSDGQDGDQNGIYAQMYDPQGAPVGSEFPVNTTTAGSQSSPAVAKARTGAFVVTWTGRGGSGASYDSEGIFAQRFSAQGAPMGGEFRVNTYTTSTQANPAVAMDSIGNFMATWESYAQDGDREGIFGQIYTAAGTPFGNEFLVNTRTADSQEHPRVAMDLLGDAVVVWESHNGDGSREGVMAQRYVGFVPPTTTVPGLGGLGGLITTTTTTKSGALSPWTSLLLALGSFGLRRRQRRAPG